MDGTTSMGSERVGDKHREPELLGDAMRRLAIEARDPVLRSVLGRVVGPSGSDILQLGARASTDQAAQIARCGRNLLGLAERLRREDAGESPRRLAS